MQKLPKTLEISTTVRLEKISPHHAQNLFAEIDHHREFLSHFVHWTRFTHTQQDSEKFIQLCEQEAEQGISFVWAICVEGKAVGTISFNKPIDWQNRAAMFGYWLSPDFQGQGIVTQAVDSVIKNTKAYFDRYILKCAVHNEKSNAVAKRCGFEFVEMLPQAEKIGESFFDQNQYEKRFET